MRTSRSASPEGPLPIEDALDIARQIAEGLEEAHEKGIVHRDLKPANVKLASDGKVKILDFGLARAYVGEPGDEENLENSPTITAAMTQQGVILGTAAYMSPEQAKGKSVDRRADLWSFGVILWEMLTGGRLFVGETVSDTLAAVLRDHPPYDELPEETPAVVRRLLERCLERDPRKRLRDIGEARVRLERWKEDPSALFETQASLMMEAPRSRARTILPWGIAAIAVLLAAVAWLRPTGKGSQTLPSLQLSIQLEQQEKLQTDVATNVFLSPSGDQLAYLAGDRIHLRRLDKLQSRTLDGTHAAKIACFSPNGEWLGFTADGKLQRVSVTGGTPVEICEAVDSRGVAWVDESNIVFSPNFSSGLSVVSLSDGIPQSLTTLDSTRAERSHRWPFAMPDGHSVLFMCQFFGRNYDESDIGLVDLTTKKRRTVYHGGASPRYVENGYLLFARKNTVFAIPMDPKSGTTSGLATPVLDNVRTSIGDQETDDGSAQFAFAPNGTLVYQTAAQLDQRSQLAWFDLQTGDLRRIGTLANLMAPTISPDQKSVAVMRGTDAAREIYIVDLESGVENRLTFDSGGDIAGCWSPDSKFYYYSRPARNGEYVLYRKPADGSGEEVDLFRRRNTLLADSVSPDGHWLLMTFWNGGEQWDEYLLDLTNLDAEPVLVAGGPDQQFGGQFSHDGKWLAYVQNRGDEWQIYLRHFPVTAGRWEILQSKTQIQSNDWGAEDKVFYARDARGFLRIPLVYTGGGVQAEVPQLTQRDAFVRSINWRTSMVALDGKRAIVMVPPVSAEDQDLAAKSEIVLITNWFEQLQRKVQREE